MIFKVSEAMTPEISTLLRRGLAAHEGNRPAEAEQIYRRVLVLAPRHPEAEHLLATILTRKGEPREALELFESCLPRMGANPAARCNYAIALEAAGQTDKALDEFRLAISYHGDFPTALFHLARLEKARGNYGQTVDLLGRLLNLHKADHAAFLLFAEALHALGQTEAALKAFDSAAEAARLEADKVNAVGEALLRLRYLSQAQNLFQRAISLQPTHVTALINLAICLMHQGQSGKAVALLRAAQSIAPNLPEIDAHMADILIATGQVAEGTDLLAGLVEQNPRREDLHRKLIAALLYQPEFDGPKYLKQARLWARSHLQPHQPAKFIHNNHPDRRLRIGWVSPHFYDHPMRNLLMDVIRHLNRNEVELYFYAAVSRPDDVTRQWQAMADGWRDVYNHPPDQIADRIRRDKIDILMDLGGYDDEQPLAVFGLRPAPIQASLSRASTGIAQMDYIITHAMGLPDGAAENRLYGESVYRLAHSYFGYTSHDEDRSIAPSPGMINGYITFGSFARLAKISDATLNCWARIMNRVPDSRLIVKAAGLDDTYCRRHFLDRARQAGLNPDRMECFGHLPRDRHLALYDRIDIALDSFPHSGAITNCEFLWHGVPCISLAGQGQHARTGAFVVHDIGLDALIANTPAGYVDKAVLLTGDIDGLSALRRGLRQRMVKSPLMNYRAIAAGYEEAWRDMWAIWCKSQNNLLTPE
ncbi:MAG: tetratricopeptide repeat protein [Pseudomonadota bacterium]